MNERISRGKETLTTFQEELRARFDEQIRWMIPDDMPLTAKAIFDLLTSSTTEAYMLGQQNPMVGFLRQFLNESPDWKGKTWTDEDLLRFIRIAKPTAELTSLEERA